MEKKKLQRIIGISVIVAFVIVLIPFLFGKREVPQQELNTAATTEEPASPNAANDPSQATVSENNTNAANPADPNNAGVQSPSTSSTDDNGITPITSPMTSNTQAQGAAPATPVNPPADMNNQAQTPSAQINTPAPTANNTTSSTTTMNNPANPAANAPSVAPNTTSPNAAPVSAENTAPAEDAMQVAPAVSMDAADTAHPQATAEPAAAMTPPPQVTVKPHHVHKSLIVKKTSHLSEKVVSELKKPAWVVQMGSFKEKSNAHRLVNQLRSSGFKAFTHVVTSPNGAVRTRVYIGPEFKQASALKLSNKVEQEVKLRGYVIPYKPMAL